MTEAIPTADSGEDRADSARVSRTRLALSLVLVVLFLLLISLGYFIVAVVRPAGPAQSAGTAGEGFQWVRSIYAYGSGANQTLRTPVSLAVADNGVIWAGDNERNVLVGFNPDGSVRRIIDLAAVTPDLVPYLPKAVAYADGRLYVGAYSGNRITVMSPQGDVLDTWQVPVRMFALAVAGDRAYVSTEGGIVAMTLEGEPVATVIGDGSADNQVHLVQGIAVDAEGNLYLADSMNGRVKSFTPDGDLRWQTLPGKSNVPGGEVSQSAASSGTTDMQTPIGLTLDGHGRVVVSDMLAMELFVIDPENGAVVAQYSEPGQQDGQVLYPQGMDYDTDRDWFAVADMYNRRIQIVRIPDSASNAALSAVRRSLVGPVWVCFLPLILILAALVVAATRRLRKSPPESTEVD